MNQKLFEEMGSTTLVERANPSEQFVARKKCTHDRKPADPPATNRLVIREERRLVPKKRLTNH
jgi:hypothetical protein